MATARQVKKDPVLFYTKLRFVLVVIFLILLTSGTFLILLHQVDRAEKDTLVVSVMENQYGFVNRTTFLASSYAQSNDPKERQELRENVREALSSIIVFSEKNRETPSFKTVIPAQIEKRIRSLYLSASGNLNGEVLDYMTSVKNFLLGSPVHVSSDNPQLQALQKKTIYLLSFLRTAVKQNQKESRIMIQRLRLIGILLFGLTLFCLFLISFLVFLPTFRMLRSHLFQIHDKNLELEEKVGERTLLLEQKVSELAEVNRRLQLQIQERLSTEKNLQEANVFLDLIIENIPDMIFIKESAELRFVRFNRAGEKLLGFGREELIGKNVYSLFPKEQADFFSQKDREVLDREELVDIPEEPVDTKDKGVRIVHTKKIPIIGASGRTEYLLGISEDITEKIESEKKLREVTLAMENALEGIAKIDANLKLLNANRAYAAMMGYEPQEMAGLNHLITVCTEDHDKFLAAFEAMKNNGKAETEIKAIRKDGTIFHQYTVLVRTQDKNGNSEGFYAFAKDISERKYREAVDIKSDLIQMVSHELRTPIHSVKEGLSIVLEGLTGQVGAEQKEVLEIAKRCADRLARLVNDVLAFHKLEAGIVEFDIKKTNLNLLIRDVGESMRPLASEKSLKFEWNLQDSLPEIEVDRDKIVQVLTNLLQNAIKFTPKGTVTISSARSGDHIKVSVKDTGIGIRQKDIPKIFRKFGQLETAKSIAPGGTGLGLAICKEIIARHHGRIELESEYNRGSVFSFFLPIKQSATA